MHYKETTRRIKLLNEQEIKAILIEGERTAKRNYYCYKIADDYTITISEMNVLTNTMRCSYLIQDVLLTFYELKKDDVNYQPLRKCLESVLFYFDVAWPDIIENEENYIAINIVAELREALK